RQSSQRYCALHGVEPYRDCSRVIDEPQRGHVTFASDLRRCSPRMSTVREASARRRPGGAIPYSARRFLAAVAIQSVVHGGESTVSIRQSPSPAAASALSMSAAITSVAGHPEYVGVTVTTILPSRSATSRT